MGDAASDHRRHRTAAGQLKTVKLPAFFEKPAVRQTLLVLYYLGIIAGLIYLYGRGDLSTPPFVYQEF